jgi:hypothetical protein
MDGKITYDCSSGCSVEPEAMDVATGDLLESGDWLGTFTERGGNGSKS